MSLSDFGFVSGAIAAGQTQTVVPVSAGGVTPRVTALLKSGAPGRAIELCADGAGTDFFGADYDAQTGALLVLVTLGPVTHIRFTGATGDTYRVQM